MYLLPNKKPIDTEEVVKAILDDNLSHHNFLDTEDGKVHSAKKSEQCFEIPRASKSDKEKWLRDFVVEMIPYEDPAFSEKLLNLPESVFYEKALTEIENSKDGWMHGWVQWSHDLAFDIIEEWFDTLPIEISDEWETCDDCAICRAMAAGKNSAPELLKAFSEQNFMNETEKILKNAKITRI